MIESAGESLRGDARRNRSALLAAAREVFAVEGLDVPLEAVRQRAGVGRATLYRRFPAREDLVRAVFHDMVDEIGAVAATAADPALAYRAILEAATTMQSADRGLYEVLLASYISAAEIEEHLRMVVAGPLAAAQQAGHVRPDVGVDDFVTVMRMLGAAGRSANTAHPDRGVRMLRLMYEALAPSG